MMLNMPGMPTWAGELPALPLRTPPCRVSDTAQKHVKEQPECLVELRAEGGFGDVAAPPARGAAVKPAG